MDTIKVRQLMKQETSLHQQFLLLRHNVLRAPIGMDLFKEDLSLEIDHISIVALVQDPNGEERVVGCVMLASCPDAPDAMQLRQMAVDPNYQGQQLGTMLVEYAENYSREIGKRRILLNGRKVAVPFYKKMNFQFVSEQEFILSGIPHYAMEKHL